jgi:hypothetical protein
VVQRVSDLGVDVDLIVQQFPGLLNHTDNFLVSVMSIVVRACAV